MIKLRTASVNDASILSEIYKYYVENTTITFEYTAPDKDEFAERIAHKLEKYPYIVAEDNGKAIGYAYASELRERSAYGWDAELSIYISHVSRGNGVGKRLYSALIELLSIQNFTTVYACITSPNPPSVSMHEKMGFDYAGRFRASGYKFGKWIDVLWYEKRINPMEAPLPIIPFPSLEKSTVESILNKYSE